MKISSRSGIRTLSIYMIALMIVFLISCSNNFKKDDQIINRGFENDTTTLLQTVLNSSLKLKNKSNKTILEDPNRLKDTVIVVIDSNLFKFLPGKIDNQTIKYFTQEQVCEWISNRVFPFPRLLTVSTFTRDSNAKYHVFIENNEIVRKAFKKNEEYLGSCDYSLLGGWELALDFPKDSPSKVFYFGRH